jgi:hypothetical protein
MSEEPTLRLIRVEHTRCASYEGDSDYLLCPIEWTPKEVDVALKRAARKHQEAVKLAKSTAPKRESRSGSIPSMQFAQKYPDLTMAQISELWLKEVEEYKIWQAKSQTIRKPFHDFCMDEGFISWWDDSVAIAAFTIDWGHNDGLYLAYGDRDITKSNFPRPIQLVDEEWNEDEF